MVKKRWLTPFLLAATTAWAGPQATVPAVQIQIDPAQKRAIEEAMRRNPYSASMQEKAQDLYEYTQTEAYKRKMDALIGQVFPEQASARRQARDSGDRLYIFISSSIPKTVLRRYAAQAAGLPGAVMVLRGFVEGSTRIKPTINFIANVLKRDPECKGPSCRRYRTAIVVDPYLFRRYGVDRVPAVVAASGVVTNGTCTEGNAEKVSVTRYDVTFGDAPLRTHLEKLAEAGNLAAEAYLDRIDAN